MYNVSTEFKNKIKQNSRRIAGKLLLGNLELTPEDIISMNMEYSLGNDGIPAIGGVVASKLEVKLFRDKLPPVLTTQELKPYLGIEVSPGVIEYVPMGVFRISPKDTKKTDKTISLVGYDILFILENSPYNSKLKFPNTLNNIKTELETKGLKFASQALTNVTIKEKPKTIRELLSDISELLGMNVITNKLGEIEFRQLNVVEFDLDANNYYDFKLLADDDVKLTRLTVEKEGEENKDLTYGDDTGYTIKIKNDSITTQNELIAVYNRVFPLSYTAYECDIQGMPHAEVGDIINLTDRHGNKRSIPIAYHRISYSGGLRSEIRANAPSGAISSTGSTGSNSITQSLNDLRVNILEVNTVLADKVSTNELDANVARIEKIINTNLESINAKIKIIETEDLTAINAHITALKGNVAEIDTILSKEVFVELASVGQILAGSGIIADGAIGDAQINAVTAGKIKSGTLDTSLVTVAGADGKLNIAGNRLQVIHEGLERVALGDVNRDGTVYGLRVRGEDGETVLFDERGLTREGLTDGSIDDSKISDNANIQGYKLDINSVVREVNEGTETIKGTKIQVGDRSLDVELSTQKLAIDENSQDISNQRTQIQALDDAIKFKVDNQTFNQYKATNDNNITTINTQLSKNTASIDILQEEIALKVSQTDVEKLINDIEIGGRNLFRPNERAQNRTSSEVIKIAPTSFYICSSWGGYCHRIPIEEKEKITVSFWYKLKTDTSTSFTVHPIMYDDTGRVGTYSYHPNNATDEWQYYKKTFETYEGSLEMDLHFITRISGAEIWINGIKLERGNKATDWTPAPEDIESEVTAINTKVAGIDITLDSITSRVSSTESNIVKINDKVSAIESRVSIAERKITDNAIVDTVRSSTAYINDLDNKANQSDLDTATSKITTLEQTSENFKISIEKYENGKLEGGYYNFTGEAAIFKGVGFVILNENLSSVLQGDVDGNLSMTGDFKAYRNAEKAIEIKGNNIYLYDWEGTTRRDPISRIFTGRRNSNPNQPALSLAHEEDAHISILHKNEYGSYSSYMDFDNYDRLGTNSSYPVSLNRATLCKEDVLFLDKVRFRNNAVPWIQKNAGNSGLDFIISGASNGGYAFKFAGGALMHSYLPGRDWPFIFNGHTRVQGNFTVTGSKNALIDTRNYGERLINAYETAEYFFGDIGSGKIDEGGLCYIYIDDIFQECVNTEIEYHVFLQKCGKGDVWIKEKHETYFIVEGTEGLEFSWELKAKRKGYEYHRLEQPSQFDGADIVNLDNELEKRDDTLTKMLESELTYDLSKTLLEEV